MISPRAALRIFAVSAAVVFCAQAVARAQWDTYTFTHFAGNTAGRGHIDGTASEARFRSPQGLAIDSAGGLYVSDFDDGIIRKVQPDVEVTTVAKESTEPYFETLLASGVKERR